MGLLNNTTKYPLVTAEQIKPTDKLYGIRSDGSKDGVDGADGNQYTIGVLAAYVRSTLGGDASTVRSDLGLGENDTPSFAGVTVETVTADELVLPAVNPGHVFAGPAFGTPAAPTFRALGPADLPSSAVRLDTSGGPYFPTAAPFAVFTEDGNRVAPYSAASYRTLLGAIPASEKGAPGGVASLDENGHLPQENIPDAVILGISAGTASALAETVLAATASSAEPALVQGDEITRKNDIMHVGGASYGAGGRPLDSYYRAAPPPELILAHANTTGTSSTALYTSVKAAASVATLPFTVLLPWVEIPESVAASSWLVASSDATTLTANNNTFGILYSQPISAFTARFCGATGSDYREARVGVDDLLGYHGALALTFDHVAAPICYVRGRALAATEATVGSAPAWSDTMANAYWHTYGQPSGLSPMQGRFAPPIIVLGVLSAQEIEDWTRFGTLPGWAAIIGLATAQTSGTLVIGAKYRITGAGGTFPGATTNEVGEEFVATATAATWGGASVVRLGLVCAPKIGPDNCIALYDRSGYAANTVVRGSAPILSRLTSGRIDAEATFADSSSEVALVLPNPLWVNKNARISSIVATATVATSGDGISLGRTSALAFFLDTEPLAANTLTDLTPLTRIISPTTRDLKLTPDSVNYTGTIRVILDWEKVGI